MRNEQDTLKKLEDPLFNESLRSTLKLMINVPSGKLNEGLHLDVTRIIMGGEYDEIKLKYPKMQFNELSGDKAVITYKKEKEGEMKYSKPIYIGVLIYDYSQIHMYDNVYSKIPYEDLIYTDTDSNKCIKSVFDKWVEWASQQKINHWEDIEIFDDRYKTNHLYEPNDKMLGSFEDENKKMTNNLSYFLTKKGYFTGNNNEELNHKINEDDKEKCKMIFKGIRERDVFIENIEDVKGKTQKELYYIYEKSPKINKNYLQLFEHLYKNNQAHILTFGFTKDKKSVNINYYCDIKTVKF